MLRWPTRILQFQLQPHMPWLAAMRRVFSSYTLTLIVNTDLSGSERTIYRYYAYLLVREQWACRSSRPWAWSGEGAGGTSADRCSGWCPAWPGFGRTWSGRSAPSAWGMCTSVGGSQCRACPGHIPRGRWRPGSRRRLGDLSREGEWNFLTLPRKITRYSKAIPFLFV